MSPVPSLGSDADYAWELATLYPPQGSWSEEAYLELTDGTNRRIELVDGRLEFLPVPTEIHQELVAFLYLALHGFIVPRALGKVHFSGLRVRIHPGKVREPDVLFLHKDHYHLRSNRVWDGADLVMEIVSSDPKDRQRDYGEKLADYALAGVAEYWIVDFTEGVVTVHRLDAGRYSVDGKFGRGERATSALLPGFAVDVAELFGVADGIA